MLHPVLLLIKFVTVMQANSTSDQKISGYVQENLGHTSIKTTEIYLHTDIDERRQVYQQYFPLSDNDEK